METTVYLVVKVVVRHEADFPAGDVPQLLGDECDYSVQYNGQGMTVLDTEIVHSSSESPV